MNKVRRTNSFEVCQN